MGLTGGRLAYHEWLTRAMRGKTAATVIGPETGVSGRGTAKPLVARRARISSIWSISAAFVMHCWSALDSHGYTSGTDSLRLVCATVAATTAPALE